MIDLVCHRNKAVDYHEARRSEKDEQTQRFFAVAAIMQGNNA
ncbi:hypothetical protein [Dickeya dadantii]|jgi:hypothetical protein|nr:hypothetical protein [Dickeya dadantii]